MSQMASPLNIACVEYYNTLPFTYAIEQLLPATFDYSLRLGPPSTCTQLYLEGAVDMALVPVGGLSQLAPDYRILEHTCIGCDGDVDTVAILSNVPIDQINNLYLDPHSNTSNRLVQILCTEHWGINPTYHRNQSTYDQDSLLAIGDKVFALEAKYPYKYDLGTAWKQMTGLPFVFAVWIVRNSVPTSVSCTVENAFVEALKYSDLWIPDQVTISKERLRAYLTKNIVFQFHDSLREGLHLFDNFLTKASEHGYQLNTNETL